MVTGWSWGCSRCAGIPHRHGGCSELRFHPRSIGRRGNRTRGFSAAGRAVVPPCITSCPGPHPARGVQPHCRGTGRTRVVGEQPIAMETVHPVAMRILACFFFLFFFSLPLLLRDLGIDPGTCSSHV